IPGPKVKFMTFNIRLGTANDGPDSWPKRKSLVFDVFKNQDADFVGLQEARLFQLQEIDKAIAGYKRVGIGRDGGKGGEFCAIYYRSARFAVKNSDTFWLSGTPNKPASTSFGNQLPRIVTWGRFVEKSSGYGLYVYNTHFDHISQNSREKSAALLMDVVAKRAPKDRFIVMGDLNAGEGNLVIKFLKGNAKIGGKNNPLPMLDTFRAVHPNETKVGTAHGFKGGTGGNKIDYVLAQGKKQNVLSASIDHYNVGGRYPSDHFPVVGKLALPDQ
ncbi:MAG TPA: endonuclease/exonuclease/phosphatase family protein, partial [Polyangiaceae bacterium]|nr:endonuclease/exonuclease/phosphatase family protein [Polyangiaceae bacterium]